MNPQSRWLKKPTTDSIRLKNDGELEVHFLGIGSAFSTEHFQSNMIITKGENHLMIDMGTKASMALHKAGVGVLDIKNVLVTHSHADHIGGMEEWCLKARYSAPFMMGCAIGEYKPNLLICSDYTQILWDASLRGGLEHSEETLLGKRLALVDYVDLHVAQYLTGFGRPVYHIKWGDGPDAIDVKMMRTNHIPDSSKSWQTAFFSLGLVIDDRVFISGDTMFDRELVEVFGTGVETIFHDCQDFTGGVHASYEELSSLPRKFKEKMVLYHLPDGIIQNESPLEDGFCGWAAPYHEGSYIYPTN